MMLTMYAIRVTTAVFPNPGFAAGSRAHLLQIGAAIWERWPRATFGSAVRSTNFRRVVRFLQGIHIVGRLLSICPLEFKAYSFTNSLSLMYSSPGTPFDQYRRFLTRAWLKTSRFLISMIPATTTKPLSIMNQSKTKSLQERRFDWFIIVVNSDAAARKCTDILVGEYVDGCKVPNAVDVGRLERRNWTIISRGGG
eukprot:CAMPEP_0178673334 /NCGR_PEP_ID=MMETSP0698-20121128/34245_1 /TAXON_ID=265572 /ORGANISM="Extubocellulus spinifer, Strain CCMP396" /LENGTH=195 /DNA_ID=CAMNT_0020317335 /DNA_START=56 /DNA_END=643 /DNA_ORIENTATION=+